MPSLLTDADRAQLLANGADFDANEDYDPVPVVKLFTPDAGAIWLLAHLNPEMPDYAFGLCDLGIGLPEAGSVSLRELESLRGPLGLGVKRDEGFIGRKPLSAYAAAERRVRRIITD